MADVPRNVDDVECHLLVVGVPRSFLPKRFNVVTLRLRMKRSTMSETSTTSTRKNDVYNKSPVMFATVWLGLPLALVVILDLLMKHFGW
jgi:hypothetical protein